MPGEPTRHVLVLDANVYLEIAELLGSPFSWEKFDEANAKAVHEVVPASDPRIDALRVVAMCSSGRFAGDDPGEVWTSAHIDRMVRNKATHPVTPDPETGFRGLGWSQEDAQNLVDDLVHGVASRSNGGTLGDSVRPDSNPPLDHEDGLVFGACRVMAGEDLLCRVLCVTRDGGFVQAFREGRLEDHTKVLTPPQAVAAMRHARLRLSIRQMNPPTGDA